MSPPRVKAAVNDGDTVIVNVIAFADEQVRAALLALEDGAVGGAVGQPGRPRSGPTRTATPGPRWTWWRMPC
ncbi:hypothetical protein ACU4GD_41615 [Cupriavidus basilensis]